ncbi:hypothetical protein TWF696_006103 [Orbilia brochopaga]|uniref:Uncharacterized protein n=1 Tax=Orbilia brochopaga TaxID=3140254 RepID=A0AAV9UVT9_9PEZI
MAMKKLIDDESSRSGSIRRKIRNNKWKNSSSEWGGKQSAVEPSRSRTLDNWKREKGQEEQQAGSDEEPVYKDAGSQIEPDPDPPADAERYTVSTGLH